MRRGFHLLSNPSRHGVGFPQRSWRPSPISSGGLPSTIRCSFAAIQSRVSSATTQSSLKVCPLGDDFLFTASTSRRSMLTIDGEIADLGWHARPSKGHGFRVWDPGGAYYADLGFFVLRRPYILVLLLNKEIVFILRQNTRWFGVADGSSSPLVFLLFFIPCKLVEIVLYCFNEFQLNYCAVRTTIECLGEQHCLFFWNEDSLHQHVVVLFFYFQEVREHYVIDQPVRQLMVGVALDFLINHSWLIIAPVLVQDALAYVCNSS